MYKAVNWKDVVNIKKIKKKKKKSNEIETFFSFSVSEKDFVKWKFNTQEWEQTVKITNWEHNHMKKEYTITYKEI